MVFDSGVGGLTIASQIRRKIPHAHITYISDSGYFPYGRKPVAQLQKRVLDVLKQSVDIVQPDVIVIACNTASTIILDKLRLEFSIPIVGVVPAIKPAAALTVTGVIAMIGTEITASSQYVDELITKYAGNCSVIVENSEALVLEAESKIAGRAVNLNAVKKEIEKIMLNQQAETMDVLVLACTHFPLLAQEIADYLPKNIQIIDSGIAIANRVCELLGKPNNTEQNTVMLESDYYLSDKVHFQNICTKAVEEVIGCRVNLKALNE